MTLDTPRTALLNLVPVPGMWPYLPQIGQFFEVWVFSAAHAGFCQPDAAKAAKKYASLRAPQNTANSAKTAKKSPKIKIGQKMRKIFSP